MLTFDFRDFERAAADLDAAADQIPFALANAMTSAAFRTKEALVEETWPKAVTVRNPRFLAASLRVKKAVKKDLSVAVYDGLGHASLVALGQGGTKTARGNLAIPDSTNLGARRTSKGVPKGLRPRSAPNTFKAPGKKGGEVIYQRVGAYKKGSKVRKDGTRRRAAVDGRGLRLLYVLKPTATIKPTVPFERDFEHVMTAEVRRLFPITMAKAMKTRR